MISGVLSVHNFIISRHWNVGSRKSVRKGYNWIPGVVIDNNGEEIKLTIGKEIGISIEEGKGQYKMIKTKISRLSEKGPDALIEVGDKEFLIKWVIDIVKA